MGHEGLSEWSEEELRAAERSGSDPWDQLADQPPETAPPPPPVQRLACFQVFGAGLDPEELELELRSVLPALQGLEADPQEGEGELDYYRFQVALEVPAVDDPRQQANQLLLRCLGSREELQALIEEGELDLEMRLLSIEGVPAQPGALEALYRRQRPSALNEELSSGMDQAPGV